MPWNAMPYGGYGYGSTEFQENVLEINGYLNGQEYTLESQAALISCAYAESGLNPWRWGLDHPAMESGSQGYGLFQFTPWSKYIESDYAQSLPGYAPNLSNSEITPGANPSDGWAQMEFYQTLPDWDSSMWRTYWYPYNPLCYDMGIEPLDDEEDAYYHGIADGVISRWGNMNGYVPKSTFKEMNYIEDAVWAFLAGYEGPLVPRYYDYAVEFAREHVWTIISNDTPPNPPDGYGSQKAKWIYYLKLF